MADVSYAMKIVFLLQDTGSVYGAERATIELARGLRSSGIAVHILLIFETRLGDERRSLIDAVSAAQIPVSRVPTSYRFSRKLAAEIARVLRLEQADILHSIGYKADVHGCIASRIAKIPQVSTVHGWLFRPDLKEQFYAWLNIRAFKHCARVIALSHFYEKLLREKGVPRVERIPTGFLPQNPYGKLRPSKPFVFGILGRLSWEKNHAMFLDAAANLRGGNVAAQFLIGGDGPMRDEIESQIGLLNLQDDTEMTGYIEAGKFFDRISALVICSRVENQPYVVMEAMARGIPVIATSVGGLPDLVVDGVTGFLVPGNDSAALAGAMKRLCDSAQAAAALGMAGFEKLKREFSHADWIARHVSLYQSLLK